MQGVTAATVSHHLKILGDAGLIACRKRGQFVHSEAVGETIAALLRLSGVWWPRKRKGAAVALTLVARNLTVLSWWDFAGI